MNENEQPAPPDQLRIPPQDEPRVPDPAISQPPSAPIGADQSGWSQPPAPQSPGPAGAFVDRPAAPAGAPLPPGAGSPVQPGPPMSVEPPIRDTAINMSALLLWVGVAIVAIIVIAVLVSALHPR